MRFPAQELSVACLCNFGGADLPSLRARTRVLPVELMAAANAR
jgi:hypothetical protein